MARITELSPFDDEIAGDDELEALLANSTYLSTLRDDTVKRARQLVHFIRDSGQRREDFERIIREGNEQKRWGVDKKGNPIKLRIVGLLKDVDTRWSSTFFMIDRVLELRPVSLISTV